MLNILVDAGDCGCAGAGATAAAAAAANAALLRTLLCGRGAAVISL